MRILLWHGYLLGGTGSNVYTRSIAREWSRGGHDVVVVSQEPNPELYDLGAAQTVRPDAGAILPVFVLDRYEGYEPKLLQHTSERERARFVEANAAALRELAPADLVFANHVLLGAPVGLASGLPYGVKAHGSELEYSMRGDEELAAWGRATLEAAHAVFVGSAHIASVLKEIVGPVERVHEVPPGVDMDEFRPRGRDEALARLLEEARHDPPNPASRNERLPDEGNAARFEAFFAGDRPTVLYFGKLLRNKGVHLLLEALKRVDARAVIVGFGDYREELEAMAGTDVLFTGPLEHRHLVQLIPLTDVTVVPSIFPEAFGMVAAEAAAGGSLPLVARHSGLAEIAAALEAAGVPASFEPGSVDDLVQRLESLLQRPRSDRDALAAKARGVVQERWSWAGVAERLLRPFA